MFYLQVSLVAFELCGLDALDERRRLGLPDGNRLYASDHYANVDVGETFARCNFERTEITKKFEVPLAKLAKGEVEVEAYKGDLAKLVELSPERVKELFYACR